MGTTDCTTNAFPAGVIRIRTARSRGQTSDFEDDTGARIDADANSAAFAAVSQRYGL